MSGGADSTCLWHVLGTLGYRVSAVHVNHGLRGAESTEDARFCAEMLGAEVVRAVSPGGERGRATRGQIRRDRPRRPTGDRPHGLRSGRDDPLPPRLLRLDARNQAPAGGRRRTAAPRHLAGGHGRLLRRARPRLPLGLVERSLEARAHPRRGASAAAQAASGRGAEPPRPGGRAPTAAARARAHADRSPRIDRRDEGRRSRQRRPCRTRVRRGPPRRARDVRAVADRERAPRPHRPHAPAGRPSRRSHEEDSGRVRRRKGAERARDAWPIVVSGDEVVAVPGLAVAPGWEDTVRAWKDCET